MLEAEVRDLSKQLREVRLGGVVGGATAQDYVSAAEVAAMETKAEAAESALAAERAGLAKLRASARKAQSRLSQTKSRAERAKRAIEARDEEARAGADGRPLTPRPDWAAVRRRVPVLAEFEWALRQHLSGRGVHVADSEEEEGGRGDPAETATAPGTGASAKEGGKSEARSGASGQHHNGAGSGEDAASGTAVRALALLRCALEVPSHVSLRKRVSDLRARLQQTQREVEEARRGFQDTHRRVPEVRAASRPLHPPTRQHAPHTRPPSSQGLRSAVQPYMERAAAGLLSEDDAALGVARLLDQQRVLQTRVERARRLGWSEVRRAARPRQGTIRALGTGPEVPEYLRWTGDIPHRSYTLNDARALVREVWCAKSEQERMRGKSTPLSDFLGAFLRRKFGIQNLVADCAYNLLAALEEHEGDVDVDTFFLSLTNAVSDRIYVDQGVMLAHLRLLCVRLDLARAIGPRRATASVRAAVRDGLLDELVRGQLESPSSVPALTLPGCTGHVLLVRLPACRAASGARAALPTDGTARPRRRTTSCSPWSASFRANWTCAGARSRPRWRRRHAPIPRAHGSTTRPSSPATPSAGPSRAWSPPSAPSTCARSKSITCVRPLHQRPRRWPLASTAVSLALGSRTPVHPPASQSLLERRLAAEDRVGMGVLPVRAVKHALFALDEDLTHAIVDTLLGAFRAEEASEQQRERERRTAIKRRASTLRSAIALARHSGAASARSSRSSRGSPPSSRGQASRGGTRTPQPALPGPGNAAARKPGQGGEASDGGGEEASGGEEATQRSLHPDALLRWKAFAKVICTRAPTHPGWSADDLPA